MISNLFTRRSFASRLATFFSGLGLASIASSSASASGEQDQGGVKKLNWDGKP